jgi:hypothetical protein
MASHIKTELSPPPPLLKSFESASPRLCLVLSLCVGLVWIAIGAGDWFMRFHWFGWQRNFVLQPVVTPTHSAVASVQTNAPRLGGDLSSLIGIPKVSARYEEARPGATNYIDEAGYRNAERVRSEYQVVLVGDSYAATGPRFEDSLAAKLADQIGQPVYNHAAEGRGTFWAATRFFASEKFRGREPRVVVWPLIEREIAGEYFNGGLFQILSADRVAKNADVSVARIDWNQLAPASLRRSLPNSSALSLFAGKVWTRVNYEIFGQVNSYVVPGVSDVSGGPMLFYLESINSQRWTDDKRQLSGVGHALSEISRLARARGMEIVYVLVPDKERVYAEALPAHIRASVRPSVLPQVEALLREKGLVVVNLQQAFADVAARGGLLYWRDDTHWNPAGVELAVEAVSGEVRRLLATGTAK